MRRRLLPLALATAVLAALAGAPAHADRRAVALAPAEAHPTGRWLVVFERGRARAAGDVISRAGARRAGPGVPALGIAAVRGSSRAIATLRRDPAVESVEREWARPLRAIPNDPALHQLETAPGTAPGTPVQWALAKERYPRAWDVTKGTGARVGVVDTGIDGSHPDLRSKILSADVSGTGSPRTDEDGHGTHVAGLACAATNNGIGVAGAGWGCRINSVKLASTLGNVNDADIANGIRLATDRGARAINMSFGGGPPVATIDAAISYAVAHGVVLVAAADNCDTDDQGSPASQLQPNNAPDLNAGRGLVVTAAQFDDQRAFTGGGNENCPSSERVGYGPQVSLAAYGFYAPFDGPTGLISTFSAQAVCPLAILCPDRRPFNGNDNYAYVAGTSMATPQVTALAALVADLNPYLSLRDKLTLIKRNARRSGGWTPELGWGIVDAGATVEAARRIDRLAPRSRAESPRRARGSRPAVRIRWSGSDRAGGTRLIPSGIRSFDVYVKRGSGAWRRLRRRTKRHSALLRLRPGVYRFYTRALDRAGNREPAPTRADARLVVAR